MTETYVLPPRLDLSAANGLSNDLRERLGADLTLDAAAVMQVGALCVQVLRSLAITLAQTGHSLRLINLSDRAIDQLHYLGFTPESLTEAPQ